MPSAADGVTGRAPRRTDAGYRRAAGLLLIGAGAMFLLTVVYLFTVMPATGWSIDMFDAPDQLLTWVAAHQRTYQVLWLLYFLSQALLLPVPLLISRTGAPIPTAFGVGAVVMAMVGLAVIFAVSPVLADGYRDTVTPDSDLSAAQVLLVHDVTADVGKVLRLFSELLLGTWLILTGHLLRRQLAQRRWVLLVVLGCWTIAVSGIKLLFPTTGLEDWLGFLLGTAYIVMGIGLLRSPPT